MVDQTKPGINTPVRIFGSGGIWHAIDFGLLAAACEKLWWCSQHSVELQLMLWSINVQIHS